MTRIVSLLALLTALALPAAAQAASVHVVVLAGNAHDGIAPSSQVAFSAGAGERNAVLVAGEEGGWLVRDLGAPLQAGAGCVPLDAGTARCAVLPATTPAGLVIVDTGDGDDRVAIDEDVRARVRAGTGDDRVQASGFLDGGPGDDVLTGGAGPDSLTGGPGSDTLHGAGGDDALAGDGGGSSARDDDVLDGGDGRDVASYASRRGAVRVDLADGRPDGAPGERDRLRAIEDLTGGRGDDVLLGDAGPNVISGDDGRDRIDGRGGADALNGDDGGADVVRGGPGADRLRSSPGADRLYGDAGDDEILGFARSARIDGGTGNDRIALVSGTGALRCGAGDDAVVAMDSADRPAIVRLQIEDCETLGLGSGLLTLTPRPLRAGGALRVALACREQDGTPTTGCTGTATIALVRRSGPLRLGSARFELAAGARATKTVALGPAARRALRGVRRPLLEVRVRGHGISPTWPASGIGFDNSWRAHLRG